METQSLAKKKIVPVSEVAEKWKFVGKNLKKKKSEKMMPKEGPCLDEVVNVYPKVNIFPLPFPSNCSLAYLD